MKAKTMAKGTVHVTTHESGPCRLELAKELISKISGVSKVKTNHVSHTISFEYDPSKVTLDKIRAKLE